MWMNNWIFEHQSKLEKDVLSFGKDWVKQGDKCSENKKKWASLDTINGGERLTVKQLHDSMHKSNRSFVLTVLFQRFVWLFTPRIRKTFSLLSSISVTAFICWRSPHPMLSETFLAFLGKPHSRLTWIELPSVPLVLISSFDEITPRRDISIAGNGAVNIIGSRSFSSQTDPKGTTTT